MTTLNTPVSRTMKQDNNTSWLILYEELHYIMAIVLLSHNNHLSEVLDHHLRSKIPITCLWALNGAFGSLVDSNCGREFHIMQFIQAQFGKNELAQIVHGRINWSAQLLTPTLYYQLIAFWTIGEHCNECRCNCFVNRPIFQFC